VQNNLPNPSTVVLFYTRDKVQGLDACDVTKPPQVIE